jgi:hypothetical protein
MDRQVTECLCLQRTHRPSDSMRPEELPERLLEGNDPFRQAQLAATSAAVSSCCSNGCTPCCYSYMPALSPSVSTLQPRCCMPDRQGHWRHCLAVAGAGGACWVLMLMQQATTAARSRRCHCCWYMNRVCLEAEAWALGGCLHADI